MHIQGVIFVLTLVRLPTIPCTRLPVKTEVVHLSPDELNYATTDSMDTEEYDHHEGEVIPRTMKTGLEDDTEDTLDTANDDDNIKRRRKECRNWYARFRQWDATVIKTHCRRIVRRPPNTVNNYEIPIDQLSPSPITSTASQHDAKAAFEYTKQDKTTTTIPSDLCSQELKEFCSASQMQESLRNRWLITQFCDTNNITCDGDLTNPLDHAFPSHFPKHYTSAQNEYDVYFDVGNVYGTSVNYVVYIPQCSVTLADTAEPLIHNVTSGHSTTLHHGAVSEVLTKEFRFMWMGFMGNSSVYIKPSAVENIGNITCQKYNVTEMMNESILNREVETKINFKLEAVSTIASEDEVANVTHSCVPVTGLFLGIEPATKGESIIV